MRPHGTSAIKAHRLRRPTSRQKRSRSIQPLNRRLAQSPQVQINSAPNGIAISGGTVTNPSVINTFTDRYPHPGITPDVSFCVFQSESVGEQYQTPITIRTDTEITAPFWALFFDGPITGATIAIKDIQEPFGSSNGHPFPPGTRLDSLGTLPEKSRLLLSADAYSAVVDPDDILKIQVTEIGPPFGGPYRPWGPKTCSRSLSNQSTQSGCSQLQAATAETFWTKP